MIDFTPILQGVVFPLMTAVLMAAGTWAATKVAGYAHFQIQDGQRELLDKVIQNGISFVENTVEAHAQMQASDKTSQVVNYILPKVPGALKSLGVDPEHLAQMVTARLK